MAILGFQFLFQAYEDPDPPQDPDWSLDPDLLLESDHQLIQY